jgi:hypothetical protein
MHIHNQIWLSPPVVSRGKDPTGMIMTGKWRENEYKAVMDLTYNRLLETIFIS